MSGTLFLPKGLLKRIQKGYRLHLIGLEFDDIVVLVDCVEEDIGKRLLDPTYSLPNDLRICCVSNCGSLGQEDMIEIHKGETYPICSRYRTIIAFEPPNFRNLEYFSVSHILLQSTGSKNVTFDPQLYATLNMVCPPEASAPKSFLTEDAVLDNINQCHMIRDQFRKYLLAKKLVKPKFTIPSFSNAYWLTLKLQFLNLVLFIVIIVERLTIHIIAILNYRIRGLNLVSISQTCRQLEIRMRQINYFPIQFLCYYDRKYLYDEKNFISSLLIPLNNKNLNVNNSNYINLFNSLWMIFNDVIIGITFWRVIELNLGKLTKDAAETLIHRTLDHDLYNLVSWVSFNHPAGFKLNNELGLFMGNMFLWSLKVWQECVSIPLLSIISGERSENLVFFLPLKHVVKALCFCGFSFVLGLAADFTHIITFHVYCCYYTSTRIYNRQVSVIKSLCQLFRGKKYNVLRKRVDNLDNYSKVSTKFFEIDQVLVGTLMIIVLILLLPTIFAFYVTFFSVQMVKLGILNMIESMLLIINFLPMFVVILKLKNSNRLQGGVHLSLLGMSSTTNYLALSNKTLTYQEIFADFLKLFRNKNAAKRTKLTVLLSFFAGDIVSFTYNDDLRINYLMLPRNFMETAPLWKNIYRRVDKSRVD